MVVAVAVSGGMDSLLALALVREAGHEVLALHAHFLKPDTRQLRLADALRGVCESMGVPLHAVDLSEAFKSLVIDPFAAAYASGITTPNPCARCNRDMKFGLLYEEAARLGADRIATGHYARLLPGNATRPSSMPVSALRKTPKTHGATELPPGQGLYRGADPGKDQSYFLTLTPSHALGRALFPLGEWHKASVPAALAERNLAPPLPSESQEVCFIPGDDYRAFLEAQGIHLSGSGPVRLPDGREIGRHNGLWRHTIGQRKGLGIPWSEPLYVLDKHQGDNALIVGPKSGLESRGCHATDVNYLVDPNTWPSQVLAQTCYRQRPRPARVEVSEEAMAISFEESVPKPTPGQVAAVFDEHCRALAGGIIA
ncbi:MAG: tRNA-specific 2-thiouridylase [Desulfovibrio sp.]|nr:tRNA-specific 2-thiouridylase [Desulfovibrio sp.]MBI4958398.1 tRNA-specific 2-thiouridylase [Desulfovibrio sp.]